MNYSDKFLESGLFELDQNFRNIPGLCSLKLKGEPRYTLMLSLISGKILSWETVKHGWVFEISFEEVFDNLSDEVKEKLIWNLDLIS